MIRVRYALQGYTVEKRRRGWYFTRTFVKAEQPAWRGPYRSLASVTLVIAKQLKKEIRRRMKATRNARIDDAGERAA